MLSDLKRLAPKAYAVYSAVEPKSSFEVWLRCEDALLELTTAVHETVHQLTSDRDGYVLISGETLPRVPEALAFFPPQLIARRFPARLTGEGSFVTTYLGGAEASSAQYFRYLLDELNAYTHELSAGVQLRSLAAPDQSVYQRDGLAALMGFTAVYVDEAASGVPGTWAALQQPAVHATVVRLWTEAEAVMAASCPVPGIALEAATYLRYACSGRERSGLAVLLGRAPQCPAACLAEP